MRISTSQFNLGGVAAMLEQQIQLNKIQQQLSTGKRILAPSDDPSASAQMLLLNQKTETTQQYQRNADSALTRLNLEESVLASSSDLLQRVRVLAVQANNDTLSANDRGAIAAEVGQLLSQLQGMANSKDASGEYLFAGYHADTQPFTDDGAGNFSYNGDQGVRLLQIAPDRQVEVGDSGASVFMNIPASAGGVQSVFATLNTFINDLNADAPNGSTITDIDAALDSLLTTRAKVGARLNAIDAQIDTNSNYLTQVEGALASVQDLDYADAISRFNQQMLALQAAQQSYAKAQGLSLFNYLG